MAVVGLGTMGAGIAEVFARGGIGVVAIEADSQALNHGLGILDASLSKAVSRGKLDASEQAAIRARIRPAAAFSEAAAVDLAIEVVPERMEIKRQIFAELDRVTSPAAILATNTSSLSVTAIAAATRHPDRVVGMHFFNPAPVMRLVEVISTVLIDDGVADTIAGLARRLGKTPVQVSDRAGFVANALLLPYLNHAVGLLESGYASREDIDLAATAGMGLPMGPLALLDLIGLDTSLSIMEVLHAEFGLLRYTPAPLLRRLTDAGRTGRKAGRGIYDYGGGAGQGIEGPAVGTDYSDRNGAELECPRHGHADRVRRRCGGRARERARNRGCQRHQERSAPDGTGPDRGTGGEAGAASGACGRAAGAVSRPVPAKRPAPADQPRFGQAGRADLRRA